MEEKLQLVTDQGKAVFFRPKAEHKNPWPSV